MRADGHEQVPVGRSSAEVSAAGTCHGLHRVADPALDAGTFGFAQPTEERHDEIVGFAVGIDASADLRDPQLDTVMNEQRERQRELRACERALRLADDYCSRSPGPGGRSRRGAERPRDDATTATDTRHADVEVFGDDLAAVRFEEPAGDAALPSDAVQRGTGGPRC